VRTFIIVLLIALTTFCILLLFFTTTVWIDCHLSDVLHHMPMSSYLRSPQMVLFSPVNAYVHIRTPDVHKTDYPQMQPISDAWRAIREEVMRAKCKPSTNERHLSGLAESGEWKIRKLRWYGQDVPDTSAFPQTCALLETAGPMLHSAMLSWLGPGARLKQHRGPFAGCVRYHLPLNVPPDKCARIYLDGAPHIWREGEPVFFDDTFVHWAENTHPTEGRLVLCCDVERRMVSEWEQTALHRFITTLGSRLA
jgi:beta-hydroxylase